MPRATMKLAPLLLPAANECGSTDSNATERPHAPRLPQSEEGSLRQPHLASLGYMLGLRHAVEDLAVGPKGKRGPTGCRAPASRSLFIEKSDNQGALRAAGLVAVFDPGFVLCTTMHGSWLESQGLF